MRPSGWWEILLSRYWLRLNDHWKQRGCQPEDPADIEQKWLHETQLHFRSGEARDAFRAAVRNSLANRVLAWEERFWSDRDAQDSMQKGRHQAQAQSSEPVNHATPPKGKARRHGPPANEKDHYKVEEIVRQVCPDGEGWQDRLEALCKKFDTAKVSLPKRRGKTRPPRSSWKVMLAEEPEDVKKAIQNHLRWVAKHPRNKP